jgi:hypothetical protein
MAKTKLTVSSDFLTNIAKAKEGLNPFPITAVAGDPVTFTSTEILKMSASQLKGLMRIAPNFYGSYKCVKSAQENDPISYTNKYGQEKTLRVPLFEPVGDPFELVGIDGKPLQ